MPGGESKGVGGITGVTDSTDSEEFFRLVETDLLRSRDKTGEGGQEMAHANACKG
jgi:hypothetical protein